MVQTQILNQPFQRYRSQEERGTRVQAAETEKSNKSPRSPGLRPGSLQEAVLQASSHHVGGGGVWNRYKHLSRGLNTFPNKELRPNTYGL